ncbi:MAG: uncharacterized protein PWQ96_1513 [Clostridia bacterium]|jgi:hypothetical protein|nr:putative peptidase rane zinc metallopeptidase [Clostridiales bacterium]MDK2985871.1 uncharacterized protein [Clostridia bacterium]
MFFPFFDPTFIILIPAIIISIYAQGKVQSTFNRYLRVPSATGFTGADVARRLLRSSGIHDVEVEMIGQRLGDHYDPRNKKLRLSPEVYKSTSLAAIGVAAHETGHAIQHDRGYFPLEVRSTLVPVTSIGSSLSFPLLFLGLIMGAPALVKIGVLAFTLVVLFQLVTLPVEFNASSRAIAVLQKEGLIAGQEVGAVRKVLTAAALTYVAAAITAVLNLVRLLVLARLFGDE